MTNRTDMNHMIPLENRVRILKKTTGNIHGYKYKWHKYTKPSKTNNLYNPYRVHTQTNCISKSQEIKIHD